MVSWIWLLAAKVVVSSYSWLRVVGTLTHNEPSLLLGALRRSLPPTSTMTGFWTSLLEELLPVGCQSCWATAMGRSRLRSACRWGVDAQRLLWPPTSTATAFWTWLRPTL